MGSNFNQHILVDKLVKLNSSQQSIETLSHWCIFHMNKAKQVVETWDRQFHCAPREQRLAFLYLANDILQNSRRKGAEFVGEFWKVLPGSLRDVIENSDEFGKNAALRLINIWEERKVFGSRGLVLKEEVVKKPFENGNRNVKHVGFKLRPPGGNTLDKLVSGYQALYSDQQDEDAIFNKCRNAISFVEKADKDLQGHVNGGIKDELKGQHAILKGCIEQLTVVESSRSKLLSILREAMQEQEYKLDQVRNQIQAAQTKSEQADRIIHGEQKYTPASMEQSTSVIYTRQASLSGHNEEDTKSAAAAVAAKLAASTSSAQMLTYVLSSLASEGVISNPVKQSSNDYPSEKRAKIENENPPNPNEPPPPPPPPPPPSSPPPLPPLPPPPVQPYEVPEYMPSAMPMPTGAYGYSLPPPPNAYPTYTTEGGFYGQPSSLPMPPMGRQQN